MDVSVYQIVTDRIIAELEKGIIPWERPRTGVRDGAFSRATGKPYSLLNQLLLGKPGEYLTDRQAIAAGGQVRKGEKGSVVVFWKLDAKADKDRDTGELKIKQFPILKYWRISSGMSRTAFRSFSTLLSVPARMPRKCAAPFSALSGKSLRSSALTG